MDIKKIDSTSAEALSSLAKSIYVDHYAHLWLAGGMDWYINEFAYPVSKIKSEIENKNCLHYIAYINDKPVGYLKINIDAAIKGDDKKMGIELERIYIDTSAVNKGLGTQLMNFVLDVAKSYQKKYIFLKAMDTAELAIQFYTKMGYEIVGAFRLSDTTFHLMKQEYRGMYILKKLIFDYNETSEIQ
jgi:ribosomal protein S18 acetylase RimI-like enzyme